MRVASLAHMGHGASRLGRLASDVTLYSAFRGLKQKVKTLDVPYYSTLCFV
jgi:hypothetical protein